MNRRALLAGSAALVFAPHEPVLAADPIRVGISSNEETALPYFALQKGFFKDEGLDVALTTLSGTQPMQALVGGSIDVTATNTGAIAAAHARGLPIYLLACGALYTPSEPISHIVVVPLSAVRIPKDVEGKVVGMIGIGEMAQAAMMLWLDTNHVDSSSVKFVEVPPPAISGALQKGIIDVAVINEPVFTEQRAMFRELSPTYVAVARGSQFMATGIAVNRVWADASPATAKRFADVMRRTADWANTNPGETALLVSQISKIQLDVVRTIPRVRWATSNAPSLVQKVIDVMARYGLLQVFRAEDLFAQSTNSGRGHG